MPSFINTRITNGITCNTPKTAVAPIGNDQQPAPKPFKFLDPDAPKVPDARKAATAAFEQAFQALAEARAAGFRQETFEQANAIAQSYVDSNLRALEEALSMN
jgi:hypothetical protein